MKQKRAAIKSIHFHLPEEKLTNEQLAQECDDWDVEAIFNKTGISIRGLAGPDDCASDLGVAAAQKLFEAGDCAPSEVEFLLFCTQSPDYYLPTTACTMQHRLGLSTSCGALDINQGCSGFIYGLSLAKGLIESRIVTNVLLVTAETYSKFIHPKDRSVRTIFSDGAAATLVTAIESDDECLGPFILGTDGRGAQELIVPAGGLRMPLSPETAVERDDGSGNIRSHQNLFMNGPEIFTFTLQTVPVVVAQLLQKAGMRLEDVDFFVFHQANKFMLEHLRKKLKIPPEKFCLNLESYGNTVSSTIPMALQTARGRGQTQTGDKVMLVGFGVGYSWAASMIKLI
jgi:3-oxoacyl-[acyl-carrier-protein] synthase-3